MMNTCRPCGIRGIVTEATWVRKDVHNWYLCDRHATMATSGVGGLGTLKGLQQLPNAVEIRQRQREESR